MDKIDQKILVALSANSRQSSSQLAKHLRISKSTLLYRISKLEKDVILNYTAIVNHQNSNQMYVRVALKGIISKESYMIFYARVHGMYDVIFSFYAQTLAQAQGILDALRPQVESMHVSFALEIYTCFPKAFHLTQSPVKSSYTQNNTLLHETDIRIIDQLEQDSRKAITDIASTLKLSTKTVVEHKRKLEKQKIINQYSIAISPKSFGFELAHIFWNDAQSESKHFLNYLLEHPKTVYITKVFGSKLESEYLFESHKELHVFMSEMKKNFGVTAESYFVYD